MESPSYSVPAVLRPVIPPELSERIAILRFPLIVAVVFLHAYDPSIGNGAHLQYKGWLKFLLDYISEGLATVSVPLFFLIAGFLFFSGSGTSPEEFLSKIVKRGKTLLVPLIFWNLLCLAVTALGEATPATVQFFGGRSVPVASFSALDFFNAIFGITSHPIAFQFWFIRDLIVLAVLSPAIYFLLNRIGILFLAILALRWFSASAAGTMPFLSREAVLFFSLGGFLAIRKIDVLGIDRWGVLTMLSYVPISIFDAITKGAAINNPIHKLAEAIGIVFVFGVTKYARESAKYKGRLIALASASFFVFASHEPLLTAIRKLSFRLLAPSGSIELAFLYFCDPLLVVVICLALYYFCQRTMPRFTSIITGGRLDRPAHYLLLKRSCQLVLESD